MIIKDIKSRKIKALIRKRWDPRMTEDKSVAAAFCWHSTPEGDSFWRDVYRGKIPRGYEDEPYLSDNDPLGLLQIK